MSTSIFKDVKVGDTQEFTTPEFNRTHFVRYAGAGGDYNPIHHDQSFAENAGLPTVFGMGLFTAGVLSRVPTEWFGPESVKRYAVKFTSRAWPGDVVTCAGEVTKVYEDGGVTHVDLTLTAKNAKGETLIAAEATCRPWSA